MKTIICEDVDFGLCSKESIQHRSSDQYSFHNSRSSSFHFRTVVYSSEFAVNVTFKPFRRACNFVYHEYEITSTAPPLSEDALCQSQNSIIEVVQHLYDAHFKDTPRFQFLAEE